MSSKLSVEEFILLFLNSNGKRKISGKLCFQKEMFLVVKEICPDLDIDLNFEPYHYGPFSKNLASLLDYLESNSLIDVERYQDTCIYSITEKGVEKLSSLEVSDDILRKIENLKFGANKLGYKGLLRYVYFNYPEYTKNSKIKDKVFGDN